MDGDRDGFGGRPRVGGVLSLRSLFVTPVIMGRGDWRRQSGVRGSARVGEMHLEVTSVWMRTRTVSLATCQGIAPHPAPGWL